MPTGTPYNSFVKPYRIRVDDFAASADLEEPPLLHLLTHTHTDHINGLSAKSFGFNVYCSQDAKEMLLRHEVYHERNMHEKELRSEKVRTFSHLKVDPFLDFDGKKYYEGSRDLLKPLELEKPTVIDLTGTETVRITAFNANHCPGAVMYLIEGKEGAVLHTGDFRAEPWLLEYLSRSSFLKPYLAPQIPRKATLNNTLQAIYLDTACAMSTLNLPTKKSATNGLVKLMALYPRDVYFYINAWTWGYEDILQEVAHAFGEKIHVDRYKHSMYAHLSEDSLFKLATDDPGSTRFHACERFDRCSYVAVDDTGLDYSNATSRLGKRVVYVNPVSMDVQQWEEYQLETKMCISNGEEINNLLVPLSRHSTLPELKAFVEMFRPMKVVPNTLDPRLQGLDWECINRMFSSCLHQTAQHPLPDVLHFGEKLGSAGRKQLKLELQNDIDVALKNLVGDGVEDTAAKWADSAKLSKKLDIIKEYLGEEEQAVLNDLLGIKRPKDPEFEILSSPVNRSEGKQAFEGRHHEKVVYEKSSRGRESDEETDDDSEDEKGRTAHFLFADDPYGKENVWQDSSQPSQEDAISVYAQDEQILESLTPVKAKDREPISNCDWKTNMLTPVSSTRPRPPAHGHHPLTPTSTPRQKARNAVASSSRRQQITPRPRKRLPVKAEEPGSPGQCLASPICLSSSPVVHPASVDEDAFSPRKSLKDKKFSKPRTLVFSSPVGDVAGSSSTARKIDSQRHARALLEHSIYAVCGQRPRKRARLEDNLQSSPTDIAKIPAPADAVLCQPRQNAAASSPSIDANLNKQRLDFGRNASMTLPKDVKPKYRKRTSRLEGRLERKKRKGRGQSQATANVVVPLPIVATADEIAAIAAVPYSGTVRHARAAMFDPVQDGDDVHLDWERTREIHDSVKKAVAEGRRPILPLLVSLDSMHESQSLNDHDFSYPF